jgi:hypothetical protein
MFSSMADHPIRFGVFVPRAGAFATIRFDSNAAGVWRSSRSRAAGATPDEVAGRRREKVAAGVNYVIVYLRSVAYEPEQVEWFAREVVPRVKVL